MKHERKALRVVEGSLLLDEPADARLRFIYRMAHAGLGTCQHLAWEQELEEAYKQLKKDNVL